jgi:invasion protein IalB
VVITVDQAAAAVAAVVVITVDQVVAAEAVTAAHTEGPAGANRNPLNNWIRITQRHPNRMPLFSLLCPRTQ